MLTLLFCAQIASGTAPLVIPQVPAEGESRTVIERQLAAPPRSGRIAGVSAEEANAIMALYIASIGKKLPDTGSKTGADSGSATGQ